MFSRILRLRSGDREDERACRHEHDCRNEQHPIAKHREQRSVLVAPFHNEQNPITDPTQQHHEHRIEQRLDNGAERAHQEELADDVDVLNSPVHDDGVHQR